MTTRTRYFVIISLLVLGVGLGTGLVAYYVGLPAGAFAGRGGPEELGYVPRDATVIAYANVQEVMTSELRQKIRHAVPMQENGQRELENATGINIETDIDRVVACLHPDRDSTKMPGAGMVLARGRFDELKIEALMREHGAHVEDYQGKRLIVGEVPQSGAASFALAFMEPGLAVIGSTKLIRSAIDLHQAGANPKTGLESVTSNEELMNLVRSLDTGNNAWAVGRFDALSSQAHLPDSVAGRLPAITWFSVSGHINGGIRGVIRAEARDDEAASNLRDVVRGFMALAKMQAGSRPEMQAMMQSLELGGAGKTVALSFAVPAEVFDVIGAAANQAIKPKLH
jgi:hypothetical protein